MNEFFSSIKADLLDRSRRPYLLVLSVALVAAIAYAALGGGGSSGIPVASTRSPSEANAGGIPLSTAPKTADAASETYAGAASAQGGARNFFKPLPGSETTSATSTASSPAGGSSTASGTATAASTGASSTGSSSGSTSGSTSLTSPGSSPQNGSTAPTPSKPPKPPAPEKTYDVTFLFGVASPPPAISQLTPYDNVKRGLQLPSAQLPLVTFSGWTTNGASATFTLSGEAILHGSAACVPSPAQCTAIELKPGEAEQLEYVPTSGAPVNYELQVVSITPSGTTTAKASVASAGAPSLHFGPRERLGHNTHDS